MVTQRFAALAACIVSFCLTAVVPAQAITIKGSTTALVNDGVVLDGTDTSPSNLFAKEFSISKAANETTYPGIAGSPVYTNNPGASGLVRLSDLPVDDAGSPTFFQMVFNSNEPGKASERSITIDDLIVSVADVVVFDFDQATYGSILLDGTTASANNNSTADLAVWLPLRLVEGLSFTGASEVKIYWTLSDNGQGENPDQWALASAGHFADDHVFGDPGPGGGPNPTATPVPAALGLLASGFATIAMLRRRR